jgi:hypothetical protein
MSRTRYEWAVADFAIWTAGGITVPIIETSSAEQVEWILSDSAYCPVLSRIAVKILLMRLGVTPHPGFNPGASALPELRSACPPAIALA